MRSAAKGASVLSWSGWLVADLGLLLAVLVLGSIEPVEGAYTKEAVSMVSVPGVGQSIAGADDGELEGVPGLDPVSVEFWMDVPSDDDAVLDLVADQIAGTISASSGGRPTGMVFLFGVPFEGDDVNSGGTVIASPLADRVAPHLGVGRSLVRDYLMLPDGQTGYGAVRVEVFYING